MQRGRSKPSLSTSCLHQALDHRHPRPQRPPPTHQEADQLRTWVTDLSHAFAEAGADALHLETTCDPTELAALLEGAWAGPLPVLVSMTVSLGQSGMETPLGVPLSRMLRVIEEGPGLPIAIGVNCSLPPAACVEPSPS